MARETSEESHPPTIDAIRSLSDDSVRLGQTILGVVSLVIWAFSLGEPFNFFSFYSGTIAGALLVTYTIFLLPFFQEDEMYTQNRAAAA